jgi:hypothetical protein
VDMLPAPFDVIVPALMVAVGQILVLSSTWQLGITGTFLGDYFGILMDEVVSCRFAAKTVKLTRLSGVYSECKPSHSTISVTQCILVRHSPLLAVLSGTKYDAVSRHGSDTITLGTEDPPGLCSLPLFG